MLIGKGWAGALDDVAVTIHPRVQRACLAPFTAPGLRGIFAPEPSGSRQPAVGG
jgi:hypothetical protein